MKQMFAILSALAMLPHVHAQDRVPVLVELFTSEGCSSCPPADRVLANLDGASAVQGVEVIALSEHVDYWDRLGWKDPYSSPQYTQRQLRYGRRLDVDPIYTPQMIVDGARQELGSDRSAVVKAIRDAARTNKTAIRVEASRAGDKANVRIQVPAIEGRKANYRLMVALAADAMPAKVERGENAGRTLTHVAVCRSLVDLGEVVSGTAKATDATLPLPAGLLRPRLIAFLEDATTGRIVGIGEQRF